MLDTRIAGSFRDPAGHVFTRDGVVLRRVMPAGLDDYRALMEFGLYQTLVDEQLLIPHEDLGADSAHAGAIVLRPAQVPMISYPYEWSLSQLRDAALVTLKAQRTALRFGMTLKDASAFNVQFVDGRPVLIDTLSFERHAGGPWIAYRQFCQHFYAPLCLAAATDAGLVRLESLFIDGLPLTTASALLPRSSWLRPGPLLHIHLHAKAEQKLTGRERQAPPAAQRDSKQEPLIDSLERAVASVSWKRRGHWAEYYAEGESYSAEAFTAKTAIVSGWLDRVKPATVWDLGANTGYFSKAAAERGARAVAFDSDPSCVDALYREVREKQLAGVLPLVLDLSNPTPGVGWAGEERMSLAARGPVDLLLALAVTHHLAIGNNVPFASIAAFFASLGSRLVVEFVPRTDAMVRRMLATRRDIFDNYTQDAFEAAFTVHFAVDERVPVGASGRVLYLMTRR